MTKYEIINGPQLSAALAKAIPLSEDIGLAVAFWGHGAGRRLGLPPGVKARILCNLAMGGTNPKAIKEIRRLAPEAELRQLDTLHSKIGFAGMGLSFVGSSNMSTNGMGLEGGEIEGLNETNVLFSGVDDALLQDFERLWALGRPISEADLKAAKVHWKARRWAALQDDALETISLVEAIRSNNSRLRDSSCVIAYYNEMEPEQKTQFNQAMEHISEEFGTGLTAYMDWSKLPEGHIIGVCRSRARGRQLVDIDVVALQPDSPSYTDNQESVFRIVRRLPHLPGYHPLRGAELRDFKDLVAAYMDNRNRDKSRIIRIEKLMDFHAGRQLWV